jgi:outer membrane protein with beta-barrel domain
VLGISRLLLACATGTLMVTSAAQAQVQFSLGAGAGIPLGTFDDVVKLGWQATGAVSFTPASLPVSFQVDGTYGRFSDETPFDISNQLIYGTADAVYRFQSAASTRFRPYLIAGLGIYNSKATGDDALGGSSTNFGLNAGAGLDFRAGSAALFLEGRFHNVFSDGPNVKFIPLNFGIRFGGG